MGKGQTFKVRSDFHLKLYMYIHVHVHVIIVNVLCWILSHAIHYCTLTLLLLSHLYTQSEMRNVACLTIVDV